MRSTPMPISVARDPAPNHPEINVYRNIPADRLRMIEQSPNASTHAVRTTQPPRNCVLRREALEAMCTQTRWRPGSLRGVARRRWAATLLTAVSAGLAWSLAAAEPASPLVVSGAYTAEVLAVASGGLQRGTVGQGLAEAAVDADLTAAFRVRPTTTMRVSGLLPHGGDLSGRLLGDLQGASNIATYNHPALYELWLGTTFGADNARLQIGRLLADAEFATTESGAAFLNSSFGWPAFISANTRNTGPAFSRTALGIYASAEITPTVRLQAGVYDGDTYDDPTGDPARYPNGLHTKLGDGQGTFVISELVLSGQAGSASTAGFGTIKLGLWAHTAEFQNQADPSRSHQGNYGIYAVGERKVWSEPGSRPELPQGLTGFLRAGYSPRDRNLFSETADAGLCYTGPFAQRDNDILSVGVAWARISRDRQNAERAEGSPFISHYELVFELCYTVAINDRWRVIPDVQWVRHPGGSAQLADACVVGLRTRIDF